MDKNRIRAAEKILVDNGIEKDEAQTVLQAVGYALLNEELYPEYLKRNMKYTVCYDIHCSVEVEADSPANAADKVTPCIYDMDNWDVNTIIDERGNEVFY